MAADAAAWLADNGDRLVGLPGEDAARLVGEADLQARLAPPGSALTLEFRPARATLRLDADGRVVSAVAG